MPSMRVAMMTREYPPEVYGGAGVHVTELVAQLRKLCQVDVHCMGAPRAGAFTYQSDPQLRGANPALSTLSSDLVMANAAADASVVHSHTWYTGLAGHLAALLYDVPHVLTAHSLEPLRPWKAEQLGGGYRVSSWVEQTAVTAADAVIAVSSGMRDDVLRVYPAMDPGRVHVVRNGIDTDVWYPAEPIGPAPGESVLADLGVDRGRPTVAFVGRITRQKGVSHLLGAAHQFSPEVQLVLCAGAPDTPEIAAEVAAAVAELARSRTGVFWVREMLPIGKIREILSAATVFVCPSVYEPLGIVNLEAMACGTRGGGLRRRRHTRGGRRRGHRFAGALRTRRSRRLPGRPRQGSQRTGRRSCKGGTLRQSRTAALHHRILLGAHRRTDAGDLPKGVRVAPSW